MEYSNVVQATFINRPNRFIAHCLLDEQKVVAHVKNTGRCKELLIPGATVYLEPSNNPKRKTAYSLIGVKKGNNLVNIDSAAPNEVVYEALANKHIRLPGLEDIIYLKKEAVYNTSRFDFYLETQEQKAFLEVKGVTLEIDGVAMFPDAPTERGVKHIEELILARKNGYDSYILFIVQMKGVKVFKPNNIMHPLFGETLTKAAHAGVNILAYDCHVSPDSLYVADPLMIKI